MKTRVAVLGTGHWGKNILRNLSELGALVAFCDPDPTTRGKFQELYPDAQVFETSDALFAAPDVDAVAIATPAATHGAIARAALSAGKHVFVEKPLCLDPKEGKELADLADQKGLVLMVGHLLLYHPAFLALRSAVEDGKIGDVRYIYSNRASLGKIRREENALWSFAPHDISMMLNLAGRMPKEVSCHGEAWLSPDVADLTLSHFNFGEGLQGHIFVSWLNPFKDHKLVVVGENGMLVFDDTLTGAEKVQHYAHAAGWEGDLPVLAKADASPVPYDTTEPLREEMKHFLSCCETGARPRSDSTEGLNVLRVLDMCQKSLTARNPITVTDA